MKRAIAESDESPAAKLQRVQQADDTSAAKVRHQEHMQRQAREHAAALERKQERKKAIATDAAWRVAAEDPAWRAWVTALAPRNEVDEAWRAAAADPEWRAFVTAATASHPSPDAPVAPAPAVADLPVAGVPDRFLTAMAKFMNAGAALSNARTAADDALKAAFHEMAGVMFGIMNAKPELHLGQHRYAKWDSRGAAFGQLFKLFNAVSELAESPGDPLHDN